MSIIGGKLIDTGTYSCIFEPKLYYNYTYKDHDRPEHIAQKYYGDEELHWLILITNNIFDPNFELPIPTSVFDEYINKKYQSYNGIRTLGIQNQGSGYTDGNFKNIFPTPIEGTYTSEGSGLCVNISAFQGSAIKVDVVSPGANYDANTIFEVSNNNLGGNGSGLLLNITSFATGYEYANLTPDPIYRYQKHIKITSNSGVQNEYYVVDEYEYANLYEQSNPSSTRTIQTEQGEFVSYKISRRYPQVTIYDREFQLNEEKRTIKILKKDYVQQAKQEILRLLK